MWEFPWSLLVLCILLALLFKAKFRGGGLGVAFCFGGGIVEAIKHAWR
jgi:hypothetical protein